MGRFGPRLTLSILLATTGGCVGGRSLGGSGGAGGSGTSASGTGGSFSPNDTCGQHVGATFNYVPTDVLILMDRSASMSDGGKWALLSAAVQNLIAQNPQIDWGLALYAGDDSCNLGTAPVVPIGPGNGAAIAAALSGVALGGEAPTAAAVTSAASTLQALGGYQPRYILLVTDGHSGCAQDPDTATTLAASSIATVLQSPGSQSVPTLVMGPPPDTDTAAVAALDQLAASGGEAQMGGAHGYYQPGDLRAIFWVVSGSACVIGLPSVPPSLTSGAASFMLTDNRVIQVPRDPVNGWTFTDGRMFSIVFNGTSCTQIVNGQVWSIDFIYLCGDAGSPKPP